ncbi:hypothetical protein MJO28_012506 [Puccinia striiformis f. sp. tritici]|uniref:Uncharacterized protein n=1 Tax=Puccinia striiformis f. sp. tritici TaxID=168172 RepID=A0ACC0E231_9BASI|nr:hypothetical protein MJO28_012506 [Puccinia striiformis f. sp. tritici]
MADSDSDSDHPRKKNEASMTVPKFTGDNFSIWERKVKMLLREEGLLKYLEIPLRPDARSKEKKRAVKTANILCNNLTDEVFNTIVKDEISGDPYGLWLQFKAVYASDSILSGYEMWSKWEDTQYEDDLVKYILKVEACVAQFNSMGLVIPDFIICWSIIGRITKKRPMLMQNMFSDLNSLGHPCTVLSKLCEIGRFERTTKAKTADMVNLQAGSTALATNAGQNKRPRVQVKCTGGKHNSVATNHVEDTCWTLHPELREKYYADKAKKAAYLTEAGVNAPSNAAQDLVRPAFGYNTCGHSGSHLSTILDSGASNHMLNSLSHFKSTTPVQIGIVTGSGPGELMAIARGDATLYLESGVAIELKGALYVPKLSRNLISFVQLMKEKVSITSVGGKAVICFDDKRKISVDVGANLLEIRDVIPGGLTAHGLCAEPYLMKQRLLVP